MTAFGFAASRARAATRLAVLVMVVGALSLVGCGGAAPSAATMSMGGADAKMAGDAPAPPREEMARVAANTPPAPQQAPGAPAPEPTMAKPDAGTPPDLVEKRAHPLLIYTANLSLAVYETSKRLEEAERVAMDAGGYLVRRDDKQITVRVPADQFRVVMKKLAGLGDVLHKNVEVRDVTDEFRDLEIRLANAEALRARLTTLLERATRVDEVLAVERELSRVAGEVEQMKGKLKLLRELIAFSTITVTFEARSSETVQSLVTLPVPWLDELGLGRLLDVGGTK